MFRNFLTHLFLVTVSICLPIRGEDLTVVQSQYTLNKTFHYVPIKTKVDEGLKHQGLDPQTVVFTFASHYSMGDIGNAISLAGRQKGEYFVYWMTNVPVMLFYNKKTFGDNLNVDKEFLIAAINSAMHNQPFSYGRFNLTRPIRFCGGAITGFSRRALSMFTRIPYIELKKLGEYPAIILDPAHLKHRLENDEMDLISIPLPLQIIQFKQNTTEQIGIAKVEGKSPEDPGYPIYDFISMGSFNEPDIEKKQKIVSALNDPVVKQAMEEVGYRFVDGDLNKLFNKRKLTYKDLALPYRKFNNAKALPILPPLNT